MVRRFLLSSLLQRGGTTKLHRNKDACEQKMPKGNANFCTAVSFFVVSFVVQSSVFASLLPVSI